MKRASVAYPAAALLLQSMLVASIGLGAGQLPPDPERRWQHWGIPALAPNTPPGPPEAIPVGYWAADPTGYGTALPGAPMAGGPHPERLLSGPSGPGGFQSRAGLLPSDYYDGAGLKPAWTRSADAAPAGAHPLEYASYQPPLLAPPVPMQPPPPPVQPPTPPTTAPNPETPSEPGIREILAGLTAGPATTTTTVSNTPETTIAGALQQSANVQNVETVQRSSVSMEPVIRGYKQGQIFAVADGAFWTPARQDLDTMLSKIDPGTIDDVTVINGPYGLRYGPGLAFLDVHRTLTPRYDDGYEVHFRTSAGARTNGQQTYGRETVEGGNNVFGYRFSYADRQGANYRSGDNFKIPSGYHNRDASGDLGYSINEHQRIEFSYLRLDQRNVDCAANFFDIGSLGTYNFDLRVIDDDPNAPWHRLSIGGWYNRTGFWGDTSHKSDPDFPVVPRVEYALKQYYATLGFPETTPLLYATTTGSVNSAGTRLDLTFGEPETRHMNVGCDFRYLGQAIREDFNINPQYVNPQPGNPPPENAPSPLDFSTNMPHSWLADAGMYLEWAEPLADDWMSTVGCRVDYTQTTARASELRRDGSMLVGDLEQVDWIYAFYWTNRFELSDGWSLQAGFGHAQRPPTLIERYADGLFLGVLQSGFTRVVGDPSLKPERDWQIDLGISAKFERFRGKASYYYAYILDYITFYGNSVSVPMFADARLLWFSNTGWARLTGFELAGEVDVFPYGVEGVPQLTFFASAGYVNGLDGTLNAPLPSIPPLAAVVGGRLHDPHPENRWGVEVSARVVDEQPLVGVLRVPSPTGEPTSVVEEETPGFTVWNLRSYYNYSKNLRLNAGIENVFDKNYQEHLDLRLQGPDGYGISRVLRPGIMPYVGLDYTF